MAAYDLLLKSLRPKAHSARIGHWEREDGSNRARNKADVAEPERPEVVEAEDVTFFDEERDPDTPENNNDDDVSGDEASNDGQDVSSQSRKVQLVKMR